MLVAKIAVSRTNAKVKAVAPITAGLVGATVQVEFDSTWNGYDRVYAWSGNDRQMLDTQATGIIPAEVVENQKSELKFGVYGIKGNTITPTIWASLGFIQPAPTSEGDEGTDPTLPVWAQMKSQIDEIERNMPGMIEDSVAEYIQENPPEHDEGGAGIVNITIQEVD